MQQPQSLAPPAFYAEASVKEPKGDGQNGQYNLFLSPGANVEQPAYAAVSGVPANLEEGYALFRSIDGAEAGDGSSSGVQASKV